MLSFTEALAEEVRGSGVRVSCLAPGATETGFAAQAGMGSTRLFRWGVMDAARVARAGHDGLRKRRTLVIPGLLNQALAFSVRLSPRVLVTKVSGYLQALVGDTVSSSRSGFGLVSRRCEVDGAGGVECFLRAADG